MIAAMAMMGVVSGGSLNCFACSSELVTKKQRGPVLSFINLTAIVWSSFGSLIGMIPYTQIPLQGHMPLTLE